MKILKSAQRTILFAFVMLLLSSSAFADNNNSTIKIINAEKKVFTLNVENVRAKNYSVKISDINGVALLEDEIPTQKRFSKVYDFSKLPIGKYEVVVEADSYIRKQFVNLLANKLEVMSEEEVMIFKPAIELKENRIALNMFSHKGNSVNVTILDSKGNSIFEEEMNGDLTIHKLYDLSEVPEGYYTVRVNTQENSFYESFNFRK